MGGSEHTVPAQATVIIFGLSPERQQLTITAGTGYNILPGFQYSLVLFSVLILVPPSFGLNLPQIVTHI
jgi:hypothetical protein